ncbi:MAG: two-component system LytT family response regulator [Saprospiraceae bacterium]|jgi:two-component system LytT family response regulator
MKQHSQKSIGQIIPINLLSKRQHVLTDKLAITTKDCIELVSIDQILYLKSDSNYTYIKLKDGSHYVTTLTLKKYVEKLSRTSFIRVHQSYLIQCQYIQKFEFLTNIITLENDQEIPVSRREKKNLVQYLKSMMPR